MESHRNLKRIARLLAAIILSGLVLQMAHTPSTVWASSRLPRQTRLDAPFMLGLTGFQAKLTKPQKVLVSWQTGSEQYIVGFNVWKRTGNGQPVKLNSKLIAAQSPFGVTGNYYSSSDKQVKPRTKYSYQLEIVTTFGYSAWSEEISLKVK